MGTIIAESIKNHRSLWFLCSVLLFVNLYSFSTLTTKPAFWYDEGINVELARNFADFGELDLAIAPNTFSGKGATVGSTGYPITVPLAGFFKLFGFGLEQARVYMLLWMSALIVVFFFVTKKLWGTGVAYGGTLLVATFAPFYGNGRSVMGEIPGLVFFFASFYFLEKRKWWQSGVLLGLAVISKPSVFIFLIPAYTLVVLLSREEWRARLMNLFKLGGSSALTLCPWLLIYVDEISRGGLWETLLAHFKNPYSEAGASVLQNIGNNLPTLVTSSTLLYMWTMLLLVFLALFLERSFFSQHKNLFIFATVYLPLALFQYLKSFGYLRYLLAAEFIVFILFVISLPILSRLISKKLAFLEGAPLRTEGIIIAGLVMLQIVHLFWFSDIYPSEKTQKTMAYLSSAYPGTTVGVFDVPQVASLLPADKKYQYLSTYGLWEFGVNPLLLPSEKMPSILIAEAEDPAFLVSYEKDLAFSDGFLVYKKK